MDGNRARDDTGQFSTVRDPEDVLAVMDVLEPYTTGELADMLGWPRRSVYTALSDLAASDAVRRRNPSHGEQSGFDQWRTQHEYSAKNHAR